jgi:hypothetical protein
MDYRKTLIAAAAVAMIPVAGTALANEEGSAKSGAAFDTLDTNRDGRISKAEAAADANLVFSSADANGDGYLDNAEFKKARKASKESMPQQPQSSPEPTTDPAATDPSVPQDQSAPPPADTETPRQ